jgi:hypothetical protein
MEHILFLNRYTKKLPTEKELKYFLPQKIVTQLSEICVGEPEKEILDPEKNIPDSGPGSWGQKSTGSRIRIRNTARTPSAV